jgi:hypothetical protein
VTRPSRTHAKAGWDLPHKENFRSTTLGVRRNLEFVKQNRLQSDGRTKCYAARHMTRKIPTFWLALILGSLSEGSLDALLALHRTGGPCGGVDLTTLLCVLWHAPNMLVSFPLLAMSRPDNRDAWGYTAMGIICIVGALTFTAIFYFIIRRRRRSKHEDTAA